MCDSIPSTALRLAFAKHGRWAGVDNVWEQKKLEATLREMLKNGDESHLPKRSEGVHAVLGMGLEDSTLWHCNA
jgi:hypothetical protein